MTRSTKGQKQAKAKSGLGGLLGNPEWRNIGVKFLEALPPAQRKSFQQIAEIQSRMTQFLAECLISFKDPAYYEEREWRAIQFRLDAPLVKFRTQEGNIVPFVELDLTTAERFSSRPASYPENHLRSNARAGRQRSGAQDALQHL